MAGLAGRLSGAVTAVDVAEALRDNGHQALGATLVNLRLLDTERKNLEALVASPLPVPLAARYTSVPIDAPYPLSEAARTNRPVFIGDVDEFSRRYPDAAADAVTAGYQATASIPIHDSAGAVTGVLAVAWRSPVAFDDLIRAATLTIADLVGQTLDRARLTDSEHELVATLQRRLLGTVAPPPGVDLVTRYLPAAHDVGIGGDFFDVVTHDHGFSLTVGDVTGHGVEAVTTMAQLRTLISGLLRAGEPLESLFGRVQSMLDRGDRVLASAEVFDIDPVGGRLRYCSAGHPWALLRRVGGDVVVLDAGRQGLIGLPPVDPVVAEVDVQAGDVLVAYTDGLVERRGEVITTGLDRLADSLRGMPEGGALEEIADTLLCACGIDPQAPTELADDVALVVVRIGT